MYFRYWQVKKLCPRCEYQWSDDISSTMFNLRKVSALLMRQNFLINYFYRKYLSFCSKKWRQIFQILLGLRLDSRIFLFTEHVQVTFGSWAANNWRILEAKLFTNQCHQKYYVDHDKINKFSTTLMRQHFLSSKHTILLVHYNLARQSL